MQNVKVVHHGKPASFDCTFCADTRDGVRHIIYATSLQAANGYAVIIGLDVVQWS